MAGEWLKMRTNLWCDPRISQLCDITKKCKATVIGALYWLWAAADEHTQDGYMPGLSTSGIDRDTGIRGFGAGMVKIGWIEDSSEGITLIRFDEHNGESAKRRSVDQKRKATVRKMSEDFGTNDGQKTDSLREISEPELELELEVKDKPKKQSAAPPFDPKPELEKLGVTPQTANDWIALRKAKKAVVSRTALAQVIAESDKAGISLERALAISCRRGWVGFEAKWLKPEDVPAAPVKDWE